VHLDNKCHKSCLLAYVWLCVQVSLFLLVFIDQIQPQNDI
jgi:hypothetical protein